MFSYGINYPEFEMQQSNVLDGGVANVVRFLKGARSKGVY